MRFKKGAAVFSSEGERIGTLNRVVIDPATREVSNIVVEKGTLFKTDKVIPVALIERDTKDRIILQKTNQDILEDFPDFEVTHYVPLDDPDNPYQDDIEASYWYPPTYPWWTAGGHVGYPKPKFVQKTTQDIPEGTVALEEGARVISRDGEHVGNVEQILADSEEHVVTHFVVSEGVLLKDHKLIPVTWIATVAEDEVHLSVDSRLFERLPEYQPAE